MGRDTKRKKIFFIGWMTLMCPLSIILLLLIFERTAWVKDKSQVGGFSEAMDFVDYGRDYMRQGNYQAALIHFNGAIDIQPDLAEAYMALGNLYHRMGDNNASISSFEKAISLKPNKKELIYNDLGMIYVEMDEFEMASAQFNKAAVLGIRQALIWRNIAMAEMELGDYDKAIYACQQAIKNRPTLENMYIEMLREKQFEADLDGMCVADIEMRLAREVNEDVLRVYDNKTVRYFLRRDPKLVEDILCLALAYENTNRIDDAILNYRKVIDMQHGQSSIYNRIGILLAKQGRFWEAEATFIEALRVNPGNRGAKKALMKLRSNR